MPTVLRIGPYRFFFFSNEGNEPPHIHVEEGDSYAKYWLGPVRFGRSSGFRAHQLAEIHRIVEENQALFEARWNEFFGNA
jgi:hypothetical protein